MCRRRPQAGVTYSVRTALYGASLGTPLHLLVSVHCRENPFSCFTDAYVSLILNRIFGLTHILLVAWSRGIVYARTVWSLTRLCLFELRKISSLEHNNASLEELNLLLKTILWNRAKILIEIESGVRGLKLRDLPWCLLTDVLVFLLDFFPRRNSHHPSRTNTHASASR